MRYLMPIFLLIFTALTCMRANAAINNGTIYSGTIQASTIPVTSAAAGISFDNNCSNAAIADTGNGCTITVGAGANNIVFMAFGVRDNIGQKIVDPVTIGGLNAVFVSSSEATSIRNYLYYATGVPTGAQQISATYDVAATGVMGAISFMGVSQSAPINIPHAVDDASGSGTSVSLSIESAANQVCVDGLVVQGDVTGSLAPSAGQTTRVNPLASITELTIHMTSKPGSASSVTMGGDWSGGARSKYDAVCMQP